MPSEVTLHRQYDSGSVYEYRGKAVFVPVGVTEQIGVEIETEEEAVHAADALRRDTPPGVVVFENNNRGATDRAELWAAIHDQIDVTAPLEWREIVADGCRQARIPVVVAADGKATIAAYLASCGFENDEIANALGVGSRTISQYISDFRKGER